MGKHLTPEHFCLLRTFKKSKTAINEKTISDRHTLDKLIERGLVEPDTINCWKISRIGLKLLTT